MLNQTRTTQELNKIRSHDTANDFFNWMTEHSEVTNIQGYDIERLQDGRPVFYGSHHFDIETLYERRAEINDWIDGFC